MAQFVNMHVVDLSKGFAPKKPLGVIHEGDHLANRCGAIVMMGKAPLALGGNCSGTAILYDGSTVPLTGTISDNEAYVELDNACYQVEGPIIVHVKWVNVTLETTLISFYGTVEITETGVVIQPSTPIPDIARLLAAIDDMQEATAAAEAATTAAYTNFAPVEASATASAAHPAGTYFILSGTLYRATADIAQGGTIVTSGTGQNCEAVSVGWEVTGLKSEMDTLDERSAKILSSTETAPDLDVADPYGNVLARFKDGGIETSGFKGFRYRLFQSSPVQYSGSACSLSVQHTFHAGDRLVLHVERGGKSWSTGAVVTYSADNTVLFDDIQADCAYLEYTLTGDADEITAEYAASAEGLTNGDTLVLEVYLLGDLPIQPTVLRVKKDGTGDYTTLRGALDAIGTSADDVIRPCRIEIYPGTYNVMDDYSSAEIGAASYSHNGNGFVGPKLYNGVYLVGMGEKADDVVISAELSTDDWTQQLRNQISAINMQGSCGVENVMIRAENMRYCIHSDFRSVYGKPVKQTLKNVVLRGYNLAYAPNCHTYGSGLPESGGHYLFEDVDFGLTSGLHTTKTLYNHSTALLRHCKGQVFSAYDYSQSTDEKSVSEYIFDGCDFMFIASKKDDSADQTKAHVVIRGTGGSSPMYDVDSLVLYDTGDVRCNYKISENVGTALEMYKTSGTYWRKATNARNVHGIIVHQTDDDTYIQVKGYIRTDRLGLASFSLYDYVGIDANSHPVIVQNEDDAIGQIVRTNDAGTVGYMKMRGGLNV